MDAMGIKRRHFLQFAGATLAATGLSRVNFLTRADRYGQAIAQNTPRKLALLVGVNEYPGFIPDLRGCLTDIELQYELLTQRFGFNPADVLTISDSEATKPTRQNVLDAFNAHLIQQAKPGDVVVFHYSGHGVQVLDPDPIYSDSDLGGAIILNDPLPAADGPNADRLPVITGRSLFLLMRKLQTNNVTTILDSCHSGGGLRGNALVRAVPSDLRASNGIWQATAQEFELQEQLLAEAGLSPAAFLKERQAGIAKGLGIGSAQFSELALDAPFDGFSAGAFSYLLTRYLWQMPGQNSAQTVQTTLQRSTQAAAAAKSHPQLPSFQAAPDTDTLAQPIYFTLPATGPAEAVITNVSGDQIEFWLGGISAQGLDSNQSLQFTVLDRDRNPVAEIEQVSRSGLRAVGRPLNTAAELAAGMLMRETVVGLPSNLQLKVGADVSLGAQVAEAIASLAEALVSGGQSQISPAAVNTQTTFDYLLGRVTSKNVEQIAMGGEVSPPLGTIALFTPALEPIPGTYGRVDETATAAVNRLKSQMKLLLANKLLKALATTSSSLSISGEIFAPSGVTVPIANAALNRSVTATVEPFKAGEDIQIRVVNETQDTALYLSCLVIDQTGNITVIYPARWDAPEDAALIPAGSELVVPRPEDEVEFTVNGSGLLEIVTITSAGSLRNALRGLQEIAENRGVSRGYLSMDGSESLGLIGNLLGDVDRISRSASLSVSRVDESKTAVDSGAISLVSTVIEVAE